MSRPPKVTVIGSFMMDLMSRTPRLPIAGETVLGGPFKMGPGGKGSNQAVAAARLGADVTMIASLGDDYFGEVAYKNLVDEGINVDFLKTVPGISTGAALIMVDDSKGENMIVVAPGSNGELCKDDVDNAKDRICSSDYVLLQLETPLETVEYAIKMAYDNDVRVILNPAPGRALSDALMSRVDVLTPNETEAAIITNQAVTDIKSAKKAGLALLESGCKNVVITLGAGGALCISNDGVHHVPAFQVEPIDTTGAGDAFNGALAVALAEGMPLVDAVRFANAAGALCVTRLGTAPAMPQRSEVERLLGDI